MDTDPFLMTDADLDSLWGSIIGSKITEDSADTVNLTDSSAISGTLCSQAKTQTTDILTYQPDLDVFARKSQN